MDEAQTEDALAAAIERLGGLDVLINNAGVLDLQDPGSRPTAGAREHIEINLLAPWRVGYLTIRYMLTPSPLWSRNHQLYNRR